VGKCFQAVRIHQKYLRCLHRLYNFFSQFTHPKPDAWCPSPILYLLVTLLSQACVFLTPFAHNTPSFMTVALMQRAMAFLPIILPHIVPERWGTVHPHPHEAHSAYRKLFRTMSIISTLLHWKSSLIAGLYNAPDSHYHRHNLLHPFRQEKRTLTERTSTAVGKVLGAIDDHPAVSAVGWDVIMSGLTIGLWAVTRGLDVERVLASTGLWYGKPAADAVADVYADSKSLVDGIEDIAEKSIEKYAYSKEKDYAIANMCTGLTSYHHLAHADPTGQESQSMIQRASHLLVLRLSLSLVLGNQSIRIRTLCLASRFRWKVTLNRMMTGKLARLSGG
jgi:hypothetical protein